MRDICKKSSYTNTVTFASPEIGTFDNFLFSPTSTQKDMLIKEENLTKMLLNNHNDNKNKDFLSPTSTQPKNYQSKTEQTRNRSNKAIYTSYTHSIDLKSDINKFNATNDYYCKNKNLQRNLSSKCASKNNGIINNQIIMNESKPEKPNEDDSSAWEISNFIKRKKPKEIKFIRRLSAVIM